MLVVGVLGPVIPCEEVKVRHMGRHIYNVTYKLEEPGDYVIMVKYGDQDVPGSPFHISCA